MHILLPSKGVSLNPEGAGGQVSLPNNRTVWTIVFTEQYTKPIFDHVYVIS